MNKTMTRLLPVSLALLALSGCGTFHNLDDGGGRIYGGARHDLALTGLCVLGAMQEDQGSWERTYILALGTSVLAFDLPLSVAGDTLTLPLTCLVTYKRLTDTGDGASAAKTSHGGEPPDRQPPPPANGKAIPSREPPPAGNLLQPVEPAPR
jgi:uncharacterized protein YceK